ncbi:PREDICTED: PDZ domain-containing protein GIPC3-like [Priapulus caudatus]|uniref:PDZ domain-containing protein GIPC3-like n=1 Tax=Priapulus caudatus TaxID=37621 RepID=A0ABM1ECE0_PRICU|nr:PREDICTED: PDZ domain-containing protein GIPC3-like [Priapulus caudatus]
MPFFSKKKNKDSADGHGVGEDKHDSSYKDGAGSGYGAALPNSEPKSSPTRPHTQAQPPRTQQSNGTPQPNEGNHQETSRQRLVFHVQQAQGSPTGIISGFTNVKELYQKISECYDFVVSDILYCTLNTHKIDMSRLLGGQIGLDDFIFVHRKGQAKEIEITKTDEALGLTITDNGAGYAFIKRIKEGSTMDAITHVCVGDHIEKINDKSLIGARHFEVARMLKEIPKFSTFTLRLVEPRKAGFTEIGPRSNPGKSKSGKLGTGKETLRLRSNGPAKVEQAPDELVVMAIEKINSLLESFMGINDIELAQTIWELGINKENTHDFAFAVDESDLAAFGFTDDFIFDLWGVIGDVKSGRLIPDQGGSANF